MLKITENWKILDLKVLENEHFRRIISWRRPDSPLQQQGAPDSVSGLTDLCVFPFLPLFPSMSIHPIFQICTNNTPLMKMK